MVIPRRAVAMLAFVTLLLSVAGLAEAGVNADWRELGGSASTTGVSKTVTGNFSVSSSVAPGLDGRPIVAYSEESLSGSEGDGTIIVKRWTGAAWQTLSPVGGVGSRGFDAQIKVARNGTIYAAWLGATDGNVHLRRRTATGTVWEQLSGSDGPLGLTGFNTSLVRSFSLAVASDNSPLVAFTAPAQMGVSAGTDGILQGSYQAYVVQHTGTGWQYLGSSPFTAGGGGASNARSFSVDGGSFYAMHGVGFFGDGIRLAVDSAHRPVVAFTYSTEYAAGAPVEFLPSGPNNTHRDLFATRWEANTSTWTSLGPEVPQSDDFNAGRGAPGGISVTSRDVSHFALAAAPTGDRLYIAWSDDDFVLESAIYVRRFDGTASWEEVGNNSASGDGISGGGYHSSPTVAIDANSNAIVAWTRGGAGPAQQIFVLRSNGFNEWEEMGPDSASGDGISGNGPGAGGIQPWVAYFDGPSAALPDNTVVTWINFQSGQPSQVYLRQFTQGLRFALNVSVTGDGRVVSTPIGIDCPDDTCSELFPSGQVVSLTPIAGPDFVFDRWLGACIGSGPCNVTMSALRTVNASFVSAATLNVVTEGLGTVTAAGINCGTDCSDKYKLGTVVNLVATMPTGTLFDGWGGDCAFRGRNTSCSLPLGTNSTVLADFSQRLYRMTANLTNPAGTVVNGGGATLTGTRDGVPFLSCSYGGGPCSGDVHHGQDVILQTTLEAGNRFVNYTGTICAGRTNATCPFEMTQNYSVVGNIRGVTALLVNKLGNGANKSTVTGPGFSCGNDCLGEAFTGTQVLVTQIPGIGNRLVSFGGACSGQTCSFLASGLNQSIDATY
ncbi:MAG TPA: hypothetical protein VFF24_17090, partial [Acidimicrobiia bacterium]|nr:hypothetical protein [Acidimicrobiia bacterium]